MITIDEIRQALVQSQAMTKEEAEEHFAAWRQESAADIEVVQDVQQAGERWIDWLNDRGLLTDFQTVAILAGQTGPLTLGPYRMVEQVAAGKLGAVFRAVHVDFNQPVSVKVFPSQLSAQPEMIARLGREARISAELDHPHVVRPFEVGVVAGGPRGQAGDVYFLAMEELVGETLENRLRRDHRLPYKDACRIIRDAAKGLDHLHGREIVHRDIRPSNIWLTPNGAPKLMEFGAAVDALGFLDELNEDDQTDAEDWEHATMKKIVGQYDYLSPEQIYDARCAGPVSDIYSLGCTFYHCLTGEPPLSHPNPVKQALRRVYDEPASVREFDEQLPLQLDDTLKGMLARDSKDRFQTADEVAWAMQQYLLGQPQEQVHVVVQPVSDEYLNHVLAKQPASPANLTDEMVAITPELTRFLETMAQRNARRRRRQRR